MKSLKVTIDEIQMCLAKGIRVMPWMYREYIRLLKEKQKQRKVCIIPSVLLEEYDIHITNKLRNYMEYLPFYVRRRIEKRRTL